MDTAEGGAQTTDSQVEKTPFSRFCQGTRESPAITLPPADPIIIEPKPEPTPAAGDEKKAASGQGAGDEKKAASGQGAGDEKKAVRKLTRRRSVPGHATQIALKVAPRTAAGAEKKAEPEPAAASKMKAAPKRTRRHSEPLGRRHGALEPYKPKPHSEIGALQDLFNIEGGQTICEWGKKILDALRNKNLPGMRSSGGAEISEFHVWLHNSRLPPCKESTVRTKHTSFMERSPCDNFLSKVARYVNDHGAPHFAIHVLVPGAKNNPHTYRVYGWQGETDALIKSRKIVRVSKKKTTNHRRRPRRQPTGDLDMKLIEAILRHLLLDF